METRVDTDTTQKVELINRKIDEINQRRIGLRTTKIEDELDKQELDEYIKSLKLTADQKKLIDGYNKTNERAMKGSGSAYYFMMLFSVFIEAYFAYAIIQLIQMQTLDAINTIMLYIMVVVFIINAFYILKYLRIIR
jgi:hypothetical protein